MTAEESGEQMLDLGQFASVVDAVEKVKPGDRYTKVGSLLLGMEGIGLTMPALFFLAMVARSEGLHQAIAREIEHANQHAVLPLLRAFTESVTILVYVIDHPDYIDALANRPRDLQPRGGSKRKSIQALLAHAAPEASGLKGIYAELSEGTHFGSLAMWSSMTIHEASSPPGTLGTFSWSSTPRWKSEEQALIACAMTLELAEAMDAYLRRFAMRHLGVDLRKANPQPDAAS